MSEILKVNGLTKNFGRKTAVSDISFSIEKGEIFGLLGPNGSGKTTTLGMILGLLKPTAGSISLFGSQDIDAARLKIGALIESTNYYPELSASDNLKLVCQIKGVDQGVIPELLERVGLADEARSRVKTFSLGMKQRMMVASALIGNPELIIFDEPTNGMDPQGIIFIRDLIISLAQEGKTILVASHLLNEMEKVCTHVAIMQKGKFLHKGALSDLLTEHENLEQYFLTATS
ncbi:ABC transporter ATP-binding protein [Luteibaculum oceani]|uniref:ATP-binding cassette domain-containing protein n=1 Tax=Luteibaculum oceani TaxID=1294296 RepID=A0A5C6UUY8_9FLAO|nr:ATP-binding cassette domain-containing protein [Luteibaculum oceani]TXC76061.1 ATP-binding cassette domain-containing protein [Luteibaculum oceani]